MYNRRVCNYCVRVHRRDILNVTLNSTSATRYALEVVVHSLAMALACSNAADVTDVTMGTTINQAQEILQ